MFLPRLHLMCVWLYYRGYNCLYIVFPPTRNTVGFKHEWFFFWASSSDHCLTAYPGQVLNSHSIVSWSGTVRPCSPWGGRWIGHCRTIWSTVCSSAPHSQVAEETYPFVHAEVGTPDTGAEAVKPDPGYSWEGHSGGCQRRGWKCRVLWGSLPTPHSVGDPSSARTLLLSDKLMSCCAAGRASERNFTRGYEDRHRAPIFSWALVETYIACLYSNQNQLSCWDLQID